MTQRTAAPIFLYTDFGSADVYVGQIKSVLHASSPESAVIDLLNDAPAFAIEAAAHLLAALATGLPRNAVTLAVVDPGVGSTRDAVALQADDRWYVGPDNGLLSVMAARAHHTSCHRLSWMPPPASASFHGRDLFAPAAARIASDAVDWSRVEVKLELDVVVPADDLMRVIYIDHYGNAMTGLRAAKIASSCAIRVGSRSIRHARVFSDVRAGGVFWYENSVGLVEIAANRESAAALLDLDVGRPVEIGSS